MKKLTPKQHRFVEEYLVDLNATQAAIRAGYSKKTARQAAARMLTREHIVHAISKGRKKRRDSFLQDSYIEINPMVRTLLYGSFGGNVQKATRTIEKIIVGMFSDADMPSKSGLFRQHISGSARYAVLYRAGFKCQACGARPCSDNDTELHIDHIIPVSFGGSNDDSNLQVLCAECNLSKGDRFMYDHNEQPNS